MSTGDPLWGAYSQCLSKLSSRHRSIWYQQICSVCVSTSCSHDTLSGSLSFITVWVPPTAVQCQGETLRRLVRTDAGAAFPGLGTHRCLSRFQKIGVFPPFFLVHWDTWKMPKATISRNRQRVLRQPAASLTDAMSHISPAAVTGESDPFIPAVAPAEPHQVDFILQRAFRGSSCLYLVTYKGLKPWSVCFWMAEEKWKKGNVLNYAGLWNGSTWSPLRRRAKA